MKSREEKVEDIKEYFKITGNPENVFKGKTAKEKAVSKEFQVEIARAVGGTLPDGTVILDGYLSSIEIPNRMKEIQKIIDKFQKELDGTK